MTTVKEIVIAALKEMGADGLCEGECGCGLDNLMPCETVPIWCVPAKKVPVPAAHKDEYDEWYAPMTDEEIAANLNKKLCHDMSCGNPDHDGEGHCHCFSIPGFHKMGGDEDEPQEPPEDET
jgi:hypothetical protein